MNCPKCDVEMAKVFYESIEVNRCIRCDGLWFDMLGLEHLKAIAGSEEIDVGDPKTGEALNARDRIDGPVCQTRMVRMVDAQQPHIRYESSPLVTVSSSTLESLETIRRRRYSTFFEHCSRRRERSLRWSSAGTFPPD